MALSYKARQFYRRLFQLIITLILVAVVLFVGFVIWLRRFIIYTNEGAKLDFTLSQQWPQGQTAQAPVELPEKNIYFAQEDKDEAQPETETAFVGYYVTVDELMDNLDGVLQKVLSLPEGTPVLLDVKGYWGYFYYPTAVGDITSESFNMDTMEVFFQTINSAGLHTIARLPAFCDYYFAMHNIRHGLRTEGGYLWADPNRSYWLDPASDEVLTYLIQITKELRDLGFDEVAFKDFCFPETDQIFYEGDKAEALAAAARTLVSTCATEEFTVSFISTDPAFSLPEGNSRLYLQGLAAVDVQDAVSQMSQSVMRRVVFFTENNDTRFEVCGVIRPINMAQ